MKPEELDTLRTWTRAGVIRRIPLTRRWEPASVAVVVAVACCITFLLAYAIGWQNGYTAAVAHVRGLR